jgi:hypothetical protein
MFCKSLITAVVLTGSLTGCGGSSDSDGGIGSVSYSGVTTSAEISSENSEALASSGSEVAKGLIGGESSGVALPFGVVATSTSAELNGILVDITKDILGKVTFSNIPVAATETETLQGNCGGSYAVTFSDNGSFTATFNDYCESEVTVDGSMSGKATETSSSIQYNNITISFGDEVFTMSGSSSCTTTSTSETCNENIQVAQDGVVSTISYTETCTFDSDGFSNYNCTENEYFVGDSGNTYQVDDSEISGSDTFGWDVSGTFYDPTYGYLEFAAVGLMICDNGNFESGSITLTDDSNSTLLITFISCTEMTVSLDNGTAETIAQ